MMTQVSRQVPFNVLSPGVQAIRAELDAAIPKAPQDGARDAVWFDVLASFVVRWPEIPQR